ncbi:HLA class II histocompatibility antigen gamma chain-like isoform X2, partial [Leptotrombidium deliense]
LNTKQGILQVSYNIIVSIFALHCYAGFGAFEPKCEDDGSYKKLQCHGSTGACWCSHPNGDKKTEPTREKITCE